MLLKKIIGIVIILLNTAGLGFLMYQFGMTLKEKLTPKKLVTVDQQNLVKKKEQKTVHDDILSEEDDLLREMDLSDLDNLDLDDFK